MRSTTRVIVAGLVTLVVGGAGAFTEHVADPFPGTTTVQVVAAVLLGLGSSLVASGMAAQLISNQVVGVDVAEAIEALRGTSPVTRSNQSLQITLRSVNDRIYLTAEHQFDLLSSFRRKRQLPFRIYTDVGRFGTDGGFSCIVEPDGHSLRNGELAGFVKNIAGKPQFEKVYTFRPGVADTLVVETYATFRLRDRLIWTVEHISRDFKVRINDNTGLGGSIDIKVNHHRWRDIVESTRRRTSRDGPVIEFDVLGPILPYQGFELQWDYQVEAAEAEPA